MTTPENTLLIGQRFIDEVLTPMKATFVGKEEIIDLLGICLVGGENLFILGPPGTAKSALIKELSQRLQGETFEYLLTRFTEPNEIFGPFDITKLKEGVLQTNTEGMLPEASLVFLDELLNANSAILNSLLGVLNERIFRRGRETRRLPMLMCVGASNQLPEDEALQALFDRFLIRVNCTSVADDQLAEVLKAGWALESGRRETPCTLTIEEIRKLNQCLPDVSVAAIQEPYLKLVRQMRSAGIPVSDRRAVKLQRLIAASALLCGRMEAVVSDMWICKYTWELTEQQEILRSLVDDALEACKSTEKHPAANAKNQVDPEQLAASLDQLSDDLTQMDSVAPERALIRDRLSILTGSVQWVHHEHQRNYLQERVDNLWKALE